MRAVAALLVVLLALSTPVLAVVAAGPAADGRTHDVPPAVAPTNATDTTNRLHLEGTLRGTYVEPELDLGTTLAGQDEQMQAAYESSAVETRLDAMNDSARRAALEDAIDRLDTRIEAIDERERQTVERHAAGQIDDGALVRTLVGNYREAVELEGMVETIDEQSETVSGVSVGRNEFLVRLSRYQSPVRDRLEDSLQGYGRVDQSPDVAYVETAGTGFTLATIYNERYVREAVRYDNRDGDRSDQFGGAGDAIDRFDELYPWVFQNDAFRPTPRYGAYGDLQLYTVETDHPQGDIESVVDGGTAAVHREVQQLSIDRLPVDRIGNWTADGLDVSVNATPAHGPIEIVVTDAETGTPVEGTVLVDGTEIGDTTADGRLWLVPPSADYELTVRSGSGSVNASVTTDG